MKLDVTQALKTLEGKVIAETVEGAEKAITVGKICIEALLRPHESDGSVSGTDKMNQWELAQRIHAATEAIEITAEQASLLKVKVARTFAVMIAGQVCKIIEGR